MKLCCIIVVVLLAIFSASAAVQKDLASTTVSADGLIETSSSGTVISATTDSQSLATGSDVSTTGTAAIGLISGDSSIKSTGTGQSTFKVIETKGAIIELSKSHAVSRTTNTDGTSYASNYIMVESYAGDVYSSVTVESSSMDKGADAATDVEQKVIHNLGAHADQPVQLSITQSDLAPLQLSTTGDIQSTAYTGAYALDSSIAQATSSNEATLVQEGTENFAAISQNSIAVARAFGTDITATANSENIETLTQKGTENLVISSSQDSRTDASAWGEGSTAIADSENIETLIQEGTGNQVQSTSQSSGVASYAFGEGSTAVADSENTETLIQEGTGNLVQSTSQSSGAGAVTLIEGSMARAETETDIGISDSLAFVSASAEADPSVFESVTTEDTLPDVSASAFADAATS